MKFRYTRIAPTETAAPPIHRPLLEVKVSGPGGVKWVEMLVDSGADESSMPTYVLEAVGARFTGEEVELTGIASGMHRGRVAQVRVEIARCAYDARIVGVATPDDIPVLGQRDFFSRFVVTFDRPAGLFFVSRSSRTTA